MIPNPNLPFDVSTLQALVIAKDDRIVRLEKLAEGFKHALIGSKSEKVSMDQYELALEDIEAAMAITQAEDEQDVGERGKPKEPRRSNRGSLGRDGRQDSLLPRVL